jgi:hypothetical protein
MKIPGNCFSNDSRGTGRGGTNFAAGFVSSLSKSLDRRMLPAYSLEDLVRAASNRLKNHDHTNHSRAP